MRLADKIATMARRGAPLPYDAEVEYLQCGGTGCYIDAEIGVNPRHLKIDIEFKLYINSATRAMFGGRVSSGGFGTMCNVFQMTGPGLRLDWFRSSSDVIITQLDSSLDYNHLVGQNDTVTIDGTEYKFEKDKEDAVQNYRFLLFSFDSNGTKFSNHAYQRIKRCDLYEDGISLSRSFIPVRFTNENGVSEGAMYDRVSKRLFRNKGTSAFVIGPDKASGSFSTEGGGY